MDIPHHLAVHLNAHNHYLTSYTHGKYRLDHAVTKRQKTIPRAFGLDEKYVRLKVHEIGRLLSVGKSLINTLSDEGDEYDGKGQKPYFT